MTIARKTITKKTTATKSLEVLAESRGVKHRDCRDCTHFQPEEPKLAYGWCKAHDQFVKLYHPAGEFWSQCQFKALSKDRSPKNPSAESFEPVVTAES